MKNPTGKKLEKIIFKLFDDASQGVDRYNHNGSLWAIFTNEMKWVVEFTKDQTLWYNYNFFKDEMELIGLDCVEDKDLIQKWFESRFLGIPKVEEAFDPFFDQDQYVEDTIQNGVKDISSVLYKELLSVEDTIQNGVKHTLTPILFEVAKVEDAIENGVKLTELSKRDFFPKDILQNGVKHTVPDASTIGYAVEDTIQNGVKEIKRTRLINLAATQMVEDVIQNGVKETREVTFLNKMFIEDTIQNGVKETHDDCSNNIARVEGIVRIGEKLN